MKPVIVNRNGLELRAVECPSCHDKIIHPADLNGLEQFKDLKDKKFNVKLRMVGNSHAISIPKEIIDFMNDRHKDMRRQMDDMVSLWFDDFDTLRVSFSDDENEVSEVGEDGNIDYDDGKNRIKRRVQDDGQGNVDVIEERTLNDGNAIKRIRIRKIRREQK